MKKFILTLCLFVVFSGAILFFSLGEFNKTLEAKVSEVVFEKTGRTITFGEDSKISLLPKPVLRLQNIQLKNATWAKTPSMIEVGEFEIELNLSSLLFGKIEIKRFFLRNIDVNLEKNTQGLKNWNFAKKAKTTPVLEGKAQQKKVEEKSKEAKAEEKENSLLQKIILSQAVVENLNLYYLNEASAKVIHAHFKQTTLESSKEEMTLNSTLDVSENPFSIFVKTAPFASFFEKEKDFPFEVNIGNEALSLTSKGSVSSAKSIKAKADLSLSDFSVFDSLVYLQLPRFEKMTVSADIAGTLSRPIVSFYRLELGNPQTAFVTSQGAVSSFSPFEMTSEVGIMAPDAGKIKGLPALEKTNGKMFLNKTLAGVNVNLSLVSGQTDVAGQLSVKSKDRVSVQAQLFSNQVDLSTLVSKYQLPVAQQNKAQKKAPLVRKKIKRKAFSSTPFDFNKLQTADVNLEYVISSLIAQDKTPLGRVDLAVVMQNGVLSLNDFKLSKYIKANAVFDARRKDFATFSSNVKINQMPLTLFFKGRGVKKGILNSTISLETQGLSEKEFVTNLNGKMFLNLKNASFDITRIQQDLKSIPFLFSGFYEKEFNVSCGVVNLAAKNGIFVSNKNIAFETNVFDMQSTGTINLGQETINMDFDVDTKNRATKLSSILNGFSLTGNLFAPQPNIDAEKALNNVVSMGLGFLMGKGMAQEALPEEKLQNVCHTAMGAN